MPLAGPATPEMITALRARVEQLLGDYDKVRGNLAAMRERLASALGEARTPDGSVRLTVGPRGDLRALEIGPRAYRRLSPSELAEEIMELSRQARDDVQKQLERVVAPFLPDGVSYADVMAGQADPSAWAARQPLTSEAFDAWRSGMGLGTTPGRE